MRKNGAEKRKEWEEKEDKVDEEEEGEHSKIGS